MSFRVTLKAGKKQVVRKFNVEAPSRADAEAWGKKIIKRKGYDDTLIVVTVEEI